ncbi:MAG: hypothetical protein ACFFDP_10870 [Promethearchaeota archaeon]
MTGNPSNEEATEEIVGNTLRVYTYLFLHPQNSAGAREVQRVMGFKSPSSAIFQLEKLCEYGLAIKRRNGEYYLPVRRNIGILAYFVTVKGMLIPRFFFYALLLSITTLALASLFYQVGLIGSILLIIPSISASIALWIETYKFWKLRPKLQDFS